VRLYTLEEARAVLPTVIPIVKRIRETFLQLRAVQAATASASRVAEADGALTANPWQKGSDNRVERLNRRLRADAGRLERLGIEIKDPEAGLIDFYSDREGEVVYLCFKLGETDIGFWHTLEAGFAGRQPL
jgi:hypothetical protein